MPGKFSIVFRFLGVSFCALYLLLPLLEVSEPLLHELAHMLSTEPVSTHHHHGSGFTPETGSGIYRKSGHAHFHTASGSHAQSHSHSHSHVHSHSHDQGDQHDPVPVHPEVVTVSDHGKGHSNGKVVSHRHDFLEVLKALGPAGDSNDDNDPYILPALDKHILPKVAVEFRPPYVMRWNDYFIPRLYSSPGYCDTGQPPEKGRSS